MNLQQYDKIINDKLNESKENLDYYEKKYKEAKSIYENNVRSKMEYDNYMEEYLNNIKQ